MHLSVVEIESFCFSYHSNPEESFTEIGHKHGSEEHFRDVLKVVDEYLADLRAKHTKGQIVLSDAPSFCDQNRLTYEVTFVVMSATLNYLQIVNLARDLAQFGFYSFEELLKLARNLLAIIDCNPRRAETSSSSHKRRPSNLIPKHSLFSPSGSTQSFYKTTDPGCSSNRRMQ